MSGSALAETERAVPGAALYVEKVRVPDRLEEILQRARNPASA